MYRVGDAWTKFRIGMQGRTDEKRKREPAYITSPSNPGSLTPLLLKLLHSFPVSFGVFRLLICLLEASFPTAGAKMYLLWTFYVVASKRKRFSPRTHTHYIGIEGAYVPWFDARSCAARDAGDAQTHWPDFCLAPS